MQAVICEKWNLPFQAPAVAENDVDLNQRSYLHFVAARPELVAAKCVATEWLLSGLVEPGSTLVEYLAGVGIQSVIAREILKPKEQVLFERDLECVEHLVAAGFDARCGDANKTMFSDVGYDLKFADFPSSSVLSVDSKWKGFFNLFESKPQLVVWTDTACSYALCIHGAKYEKKLGAKLESWEDYVGAYSAYLFHKVGYWVKKAAFRGKNAIYFAAMPGWGEVEMRKFALGECSDGFRLGKGCVL